MRHVFFDGALALAKTLRATSAVGIAPSRPPLRRASGGPWDTPPRPPPSGSTRRATRLVSVALGANTKDAASASTTRCQQLRTGTRGEPWHLGNRLTLRLNEHDRVPLRLAVERAVSR